MPNKRQLEKQIGTIEGLRDIIHSMRSLAATYLSRAEERLEGVRAYADTAGRAIEDCLRGSDIATPDELTRGTAIIGFFSEQGLCGRFNEVLAEAAAERAAEVQSPHFIAVGRRGPGLLRMMNLDLLAELPSTTSPSGIDAVIHDIARTAMQLHRKNAFAELYLLYAHYLSPGRIRPTFERVLPIDLSQYRREGTEAARPTLGLSRITLLMELVDEHAFVSLYRAMIESLASENGMRLQSMEAAKSNIDDTLSDLQMRARRERQNEITDELLDIVAGAEALADE